MESVGNHIPARQRSYDLVVDAGIPMPSACRVWMRLAWRRLSFGSGCSHLGSGACSMDAYEAGGDDDPLGASLLALNGVQGHNICAGGDVDWNYFQRKPEKPLTWYLKRPTR